MLTQSKITKDNYTHSPRFYSHILLQNYCLSLYFGRRIHRPNPIYTSNKNQQNSFIKYLRVENLYLQSPLQTEVAVATVNTDICIYIYYK